MTTEIIQHVLSVATICISVLIIVTGALSVFFVLSWVTVEIFTKAVLQAKVWHRMMLFMWYYNRGLKEKLDELDKNQTTT